MIPGLFGIMGSAGNGQVHMPGHGHGGSNLLGSALQGGMSLKTIKAYFPKMAPEAKRRIKARKKSRR